MFNSGDVVEEVATGRQGVLQLTGMAGAILLTVYFGDALAPFHKRFSDPRDLRLVHPGELDGRMLPHRLVESEYPVA